MEEIVSIHSIVHKKKKNITKNVNRQSLTKSSSKISKKNKSHSVNKPILIGKIINNITNDIHPITRKNISQKKQYNNISLYKTYDFEQKKEPILHIHTNNLNLLSDQNLKNKEEPNTPVMKLQRNKKPNYLMKSAFIKDKSLTPQEKSFQNTLCPIYDFYTGNSGFNTSKNDNLLKNTSFTQYHNNFKSTNNLQYNDFFNQGTSPITNLSDNNNINNYFNYSFMGKKQIGKDYFDKEKINQMNELSHDRSPHLDDQEKNSRLYNIEKEDNYLNLNNDLQKFEGNTPSNLGGAFSHSDDFFDENIFGSDNNFFKSPINYKQMNVNININNNSQNNNIYYQLPNFINNYNNNNSSNNNYYSNTYNNNDIYDDYNDNLNQNINYENFTNNIINQLNDELYNKDNLLNNKIYNNNESNIGNIYKNREHNQNNLQKQINVNNQIGNQNLSYQNINRNRNNKLSQLSQLNQQIENYLKQCSKMKSNNNNNNNNLNKNDMMLNHQNNNNINYNINYNQNNNNSNNIKNINFSSIANAYMNNNLINQNIYNNKNNENMNQMQIPIKNNINNNNNGVYNQMSQYYLNKPERIFFQNNNNSNSNLNNQIYNNYSYMNNNNNINQSNYNDTLNNQINYLYQYNNTLPESILYSLTPVQLAQQCHIIAKNQNGCRYIQNCIMTNLELLNTLFFPKILEHIAEISNDQFANYLVKKVFHYLSEEMILQLIKALIPIIDEIGTNQYGTRVLQDLIDFLNTDKTFMAFVNIIIPHVKLLVVDLNGSHIIYKLILTKNKNVKIIENIICTQVKDIAITRKGCSFLKKYFDFANENELLKIKQCILKDLKDIITDQYGNYVIQSILIKENSIIVKDFLNEIIKNIVFYSNNKFSSNAVEKCFENESIKNIILDQFMKKEIFEKIITDKFGNYVVQKAIAKADNNRKNYMLQLLIPLIPNLKSQYFGQRLLSKLILQYPNLNISL